MASSKRSPGLGAVEHHGSGWRVRVTVDGRRKVIASGLATRAEAEQIAVAFAELQIQRPRHRGLTLREYIATGYFAERKRLGYSLRAIKADESRWQTYVSEHKLAGFAMRTIKRSHIVEWRNWLLSRNLAPNTVTNALNMLRTIFHTALDADLIEHNPASDVRVPRRLKKTTSELDGILAPDEQLRVLQAVPLSHRAMTATALYTGLRLEELYRLEWVDVRDDGLTVRKAKSGRPRDVPLFPPAQRALKSLERTKGLVFPGRGKRLRYPKRPKDWPLWVRSAGLDRRIRWHDLRHTCATALLAGWWGPAWSLETVCQMLGHASVTTTERYARKLQSTLRLAAAGVASELPDDLFQEPTK